MNLREHLWTILQEECAEIIQCVSKIKRFGIHNTQPSSGEINLQILNNEYNDFLGIIEALQEEGIPINEDRYKVESKKLKVKHFLEVSRKAGTLK